VPDGLRFDVGSRRVEAEPEASLKRRSASSRLLDMSRADGFCPVGTARRSKLGEPLVGAELFERTTQPRSFGDERGEARDELGPPARRRFLEVQAVEDLDLGGEQLALGLGEPLLQQVVCGAHATPPLHGAGLRRSAIHRRRRDAGHAQSPPRP
jgi:hypothetical protein